MLVVRSRESGVVEELFQEVAFDLALRWALGQRRSEGGPVALPRRRQSACVSVSNLNIRCLDLSRTR